MAEKESNDNYLKALSQAESGKAVRDHLKHSDFADQVMDILRKHTDFSDITRRSLFRSVSFWLTLLPIVFIIDLGVMKFPQIAEWLLTFFRI